MGMYLWVFVDHHGVNTMINSHKFSGQKSLKGRIVFTCESYSDCIVGIQGKHGVGQLVMCLYFQ